MRIRRFDLAPLALCLGAVLFAAGCAPEESASTARRDQAVEPAPAAQPAETPGDAAVSSSLPAGRYVCYRLASHGDEVVGDLLVHDADGYRYSDAEGSYRYSPSDRLVEWESGPLHQPGEDWVGVLTPRGAAVGAEGGSATEHRIEIRRRADVQAGNMAVMQRCHFAR